MLSLSNSYKYYRTQRSFIEIKHKIMEQTRGPNGVRGTHTIPPTIYEDFKPASDWTHDPKSNVLLVDLPGFKKEQLKVQINNLGKLTISGERHVRENNYQRFTHVFDMPENSDYNSISARFDSEAELLYIIIPKKKTEEPKDKDQSKTEKEKKEDEKHVEKEVPKKNNVHEQDKKDKSSQEGLKEDEKHVEKEVPKKNNVHEQDKKDKSSQEGLKEDENRKGGEEKERNGENKKSLDGEGTREGKRTEEWWNVEKKEQMEDVMRSGMEEIRKRKIVIFTMGLALSLGLYISYKFFSGGE